MAGQRQLRWLRRTARPADQAGPRPPSLVGPAPWSDPEGRGAPPRVPGPGLLQPRSPHADVEVGAPEAARRARPSWLAGACSARHKWVRVEQTPRVWFDTPPGRFNPPGSFDTPHPSPAGGQLGRPLVPRTMTRRAGTGSWSGARRSFPPSVRRSILDRDGGVCQLGYPGCAVTATEADHIIPVAEGGTDDEANGQAVCPPCHRRKTAEEIARGKARQPRRKRPPAPHPGLVDPPAAPGG